MATRSLPFVGATGLAMALLIAIALAAPADGWAQAAAVEAQSFGDFTVQIPVGWTKIATPEAGARSCAPATARSGC